MKLSRSGVLAALVVVALGVGVAGIGAAVASTVASDASTDEFCAVLPDSIGLYEGNPVTRMGVEIGKIGSIRPTGDTVEVVFALDDTTRIPGDVAAVTRSKSLLADRSLELVGGTSDGPPLEQGTCIPKERAFTPKSISQVVGSVADFLEALTPEGSDQSIESVISGLDAALEGQGPEANSMLTHAGSAMESPDQFVADIGSSIQNMAPLADRSLEQWQSITSLISQLPAITSAGIELWDGTDDVAYGIGWLVATLNEVQTRYGGDIWPFLKGPAVDAISLAASRVDDISNVLSALPALATFVTAQSQKSASLSLDYTPPQVAVQGIAADLLCSPPIGGPGTTCTGSGDHVLVPALTVLDHVLTSGATS